MNMQYQLPEPFHDLERFAEWSLPSSAARTTKRISSSKEDLRTFYDGMIPRMEAVLDYLNEFPLHNLPQAEKLLLNIALSIAEIGIYVEWFDAPISPIARGTGEKLEMIFEPMDV